MYHSNRNSSPYCDRQQLNQSPEQQIHESLDKYLNVQIHQNYTDKLKKQIIIAQIETLNSELSSICKDRFGDLTAGGGDKNQPQWFQIDKTIKLVKFLISHIHRDAQNKKQLSSKFRKNQQETNKLNNINDKLCRQKRSLQKQKQSLDLKLKALQRQFKEEMQKIKKQKDQAQKKFQQISNKQNQYKNQVRKNQQMIAQLQEKIKNKNIDKGQVKNKFQKVQQVKNYGPTLILSNSENEFNNYFVNNFQANHRAIVEENQYLKKCLQSVYQQLYSLLQVKKDVIRKRKGFESALDSEAFQLESIKPQTFNLPKQFSQDSIQKLNQNLLKFKQALKLNDLVNDKVQDQKIQCVNNVKNLISNYKQIVESQDKLINRVVLKSKQFKTNQMSNIDNKYGKTLEQDDLQRSKRFLQQQRQILLTRNKQLELTRKAMKNTIKKAEEEKKHFNKKRIQTNEQLQVLKKNIEKLPAMIQEQLNTMM